MAGVTSHLTVGHHGPGGDGHQHRDDVVEPTIVNRR